MRSRSEFNNATDIALNGDEGSSPFTHIPAELESAVDKDAERTQEGAGKKNGGNGIEEMEEEHLGPQRSVD